MKRFYFLLILMLIIQQAWSVYPVRKPFVVIMVNNKNYSNGSNIIVDHNQSLLITVSMEGGRRDYVKFPDTYADIMSSAEILSRGDNKLVYKIDGQMAEWQLLTETASFVSDGNVKIQTSPSEPTSAKLTISQNDFPQSYVRINMKTTWQFEEGDTKRIEENLAEATVYFSLKGETDVWFSSRNVMAKGIMNDLVKTKLEDIQSSYDSIESKIFKLDFTAAQQEIRTLQQNVNSLKNTLDEVKVQNHAFQSTIVLIGLPTDRPYLERDDLTILKQNWTAGSEIIAKVSSELNTLPIEGSNDKNKLLELISQYSNWQKKLPENTFSILNRYIPSITEENVKMSGNLRYIAEKGNIDNYTSCRTDAKEFFDKRVGSIQEELNLINNAQVRIQAVRLFDGMLRSYVSSIRWVEWKSTRE